MSLERNPKQVLVDALVVVLLQSGFSAGSCGVASGEHVMFDRVEETHLEDTRWGGVLDSECG